MPRPLAGQNRSGRAERGLCPTGEEEETKRN